MIKWSPEFSAIHHACADSTGQEHLSIFNMTCMLAKQIPIPALIWEYHDVIL